MIEAKSDLDISTVARMDLECYPVGWEILKLQKHRCLLFEPKVAYAVIDDNDLRQFKVIRFGVHPGWRRMKFGSMLMTELIEMAEKQGKVKMSIVILESNLPGCHFLKAQNFRAESVLREYAEFYGKKEDAYYFLRSLK